MSGGYIPQEILDEILAKTDIVAVIGEYVPLKRAGANYTGLCPFHNEKTPSFSVSPSKQIFYCFGCGTGGNVFRFMMLIENLSFREAVEKLAQKAGVILPERELTAAEKKRLSYHKRLYDINTVAAKYYQKVLWETKQGNTYLSYLKNRGMTEEMIVRFGLGATSSGWDGLSRFLASKGVTEQEMIDLGLALPRKEGRGCYDRFRERVMFPIREEKGKVIAFGGRLTDPNVKQQKYMNSPDTPLFHKGKMLYGLDQAKSNIRQKDAVVLVEGYMDVITCHQYGITNAVAALGTSFTADQAKLLMRNTYQVYVSFDGDAAGDRAAWRSLDILGDLGCNVRIISLPGGRDPDEYLKEFGQKSFEEEMARSREFFVYKIDRLMEKMTHKDISGKLAIVREILPDLKKITSPVALESAMATAAEKLQITQQAIFVEMHSNTKTKQPIETKDKKEFASQKNAVSLPDAQAKNEAMILAMIYADKHRLSDVENAGGSSLFRGELQDIYHTLQRNAQKDEGLSDEWQSFLTGILMQNEILYQNDQKKDLEIAVFSQKLQDLQLAKVSREYDDLLKCLIEAEKSADQKRIAEILQRLEYVRKEKSDLENLERGTS